MKLIGIDGAKLGHWVTSTCDGRELNPPVCELTDKPQRMLQ